MRPNTILRRSLAALALVAVISPAAIAEEKSPRDVLTRAATLGRFRTLVTAVVAAGLDDALKGDGPFTVLAPSDEAFAKLPTGTIESLLAPEKRGELVELLKYHVLPGRLMAKDLASAGKAKTLAGTRITVAANGQGVAINDAVVVTADVPCKNGVIHEIDRVLTPAKPRSTILEVAKSKGKFQILAAALQAADLDVALEGDGPYTVLAPTDEAFVKLGKHKLKALLEDPSQKQTLRDILTYHVIAGSFTARDAIRAENVKTLQGKAVRVRIEDGRLFFEESKAIATDVKADNGLIHAIDAVLIPDKK